MVIDSRLIDANGEAEITENFNRVISLIDQVAANIKCTVTFSSDGGSAVDSQSVAFGETAVEPDPPAKAGNAFAGWYLGEALYSFTEAVTASITLTAHWITE